MTNSLWWPIILSAVLLVLGLLLLVLPWDSAVGLHELRPWQDFDVVVLPNHGDEAQAVQQLISADEEVLYIGNASVVIEDFRGGSEVVVADLPERLDPDDPRFDPFIASLPSLFRIDTPGGSAAIVYLERRGSIMNRWAEIDRLLEGVEFYLLGWQPLLPAVSAVVVLISLIPAAMAVRRRRLSAVVIQLTVTAYTVIGGPHAVIPAALAGLAWMYWNSHSYNLEREWLVHGRNGRWDREHTPALLFLVAATIGLLATAPTARSAAGVMGALVGVWALSAAVHRRNVLRSEHRLFAPRRILRGRVTFPGLVPGLTVLVAGSAVLIALNAGRGALSSGTTAPVPEHLAVGQPVIGSGAEAMSAEGDVERIVEGMRTLSPEDTPLSTAGYVAHRWYQETLLYGGRYEVPEMNEGIALQRLRRESGGLEAYRSEVTRFDEEWISRQFDAPTGSAYRFFFQERGAFQVTFQPLRLPVLDVLLYGRRAILLLIPFITLGLSIRLPYRGVLGTVGAASRSERQEL
ncbi:MAG: hypothetical protein ACOCU4_07235 [Alkalispirochaeta sp.]